MQFSTWLQVITSVALVGGVVFAGVEWRASRNERRRQQENMLLRSFDSLSFTRAMRVVMNLPDGRSKSEIDALGETADLVWHWLGVMEQIGTLVRHGELALSRVDDTLSAPLQVSWRKLSQFVGDSRQLYGETFAEHAQWLVEGLDEFERVHGRAPAYARETGEA
jgi:hypothetical protein